MKLQILLLVVILPLKLSLGQTTAVCDGLQVFLTQNGICDYNPWVTVFEDNFDGNTLDLTKWILPYQGVLRDFNHSKEKQWYTNTGNTPFIPVSNNIEVSNGTLKLIARREIPPITGTYISDYSVNPWTFVTESFNYSSAEIDSRYKFSYGMYEIRCKIPSGKGFWPAFWMYGEDAANVNNEIDVFEFWDNNTNKINMTAHYNGQMCLDYFNGPNYATSFHTFTVIWDNYKMEWYVDGILRRRSTKFYTLLGQPKDCNGIFALDHYILDKVFPKDPLNIIANLALQTGIFEPDANTPFPRSLEIDYIRYSQKKGCAGVVNATNITQLNLSNVIYNHIIGTIITVGSNFTVQSGQQLEFAARDEIILGPGFSAKAGSNFVARIDPTICDGGLKFGASLSNGSSSSDTLEYSHSPISSTNSTINCIAKNIKINIYPNPSNGILFIDFQNESSENYEIYLVSAQGKLVYEIKSILESKFYINMNDFRKGNYFIKILNKTSKNAIVYKIIH